MKIIELDGWPRREHYEFFMRGDHPQYSVTAPLDITRFLEGVKKENLSFYLTMIFQVVAALDSLEPFRYRIQDGNVILHDRTHPVFTDLKKGDSDFFLYLVNQGELLSGFMEEAERVRRHQTGHFDLSALQGRSDLHYISCLPKISFTEISHTWSNNKEDAIPRISWGQYYRSGDSVLIPFNIQVHHAFVDGCHLGDLFVTLQDRLNKGLLTTRSS